jgi:N6-adenosine-specific RNA methylase IME4
MPNPELIVDSEFQALIPPLQPDERQLLEESVLREGCRDALVVWRGYLVDGHNRYEICTENNLSFDTVELQNCFNRNDVLLWMIRNQLGRRNLTPYVRTELALKLKPVIAEQARENQLGGLKQNTVLENSPKRAESVDTRAIIAASAGVSDNTVSKVEAIIQNAPEAVKEQLRKGQVSINAAFTELKQEERKAKQEAKRQELAQRDPAPIKDDAPVSLILADPPWRYDFAETSNREIENHYPTATTDEIGRHLQDFGVPVSGDCVLFLWATAPKLREALAVMEAWGFEYKTQAVWDKQRTGMGYWFRGRHEILLVGVRGSVSPPPPDCRFDSVFVEKRDNQHSQKPECVYEAIEAMFPQATRAEIYARRSRTGWRGYGNEAQ